MGLKELKIVGEDKLKRVFVSPKEIMWYGNGVKNADFLLKSAIHQVYVGIPEVAVLENTENKKAALLIDFGSEIVGGLELIVSRSSGNKEGVRLHVRFGESVAEAMTPIAIKNATNDHAVRDMDIILSQYSQQSFAYTGFRFVYIELVDSDAWIEIANIRAILTYRDIEYKGYFECSDSVLNQIYDVAAYTVHLNMQNELWDGIKRDRLVWIGDSHPEMLAIRSVFGDEHIIDDCLKFIAQSNPIPQWPNHFTTYSFWYILILWDWYWYNGRKELILDLQQYWVGLVTQLLSLVHHNEQEIIREIDFEQGFFIDWQTKDTEEAKAGVYALLRLTLLAANKLCILVGNNDVAQECLKVADMLKKQSLIHNGRKQIVALMSLAGLLDDNEVEDVIVKDNANGMSTFMSYYILSTITKTNGITDAINILKDYYGAMLDTGATTFWEDFDIKWSRPDARIDRILQSDEYDIHGENGRFCYQGLRHSLCHGWSAGPVAFLAEYVMGIQILDAGCKKIKIAPNLGPLSWVKGAYPTPYGLVKVQVEQSNGRLSMHVDAPKDIEIIK